jgi:hypothetical protein
MDREGKARKEGKKDGPQLPPLLALAPQTGKVLKGYVDFHGRIRVMAMASSVHDEKQMESISSVSLTAAVVAAVHQVPQKDVATTLAAGSHAFVRCAGESYLRIHELTFKFGDACGHMNLVRPGDDAVSVGEIELDSNGYLLRWSNMSGSFRPPASSVGQSGLPYELLWLHSLPTDTTATAGSGDADDEITDDFYVSDPVRMRDLERNGKLIRLSSGAQLVNIETAGRFTITQSSYAACKRIYKEFEDEKNADPDLLVRYNVVENIATGKQERRAFLTKLRYGHDHTLLP